MIWLRADTTSYCEQCEAYHVVFDGEGFANDPISVVEDNTFATPEAAFAAIARIVWVPDAA